MSVDREATVATVEHAYALVWRAAGIPGEVTATPARPDVMQHISAARVDLDEEVLGLLRAASGSRA